MKLKDSIGLGVGVFRYINNLCFQDFSVKSGRENMVFVKDLEII